MHVKVVRHGTVTVLQPTGILNAESLPGFAETLEGQVRAGQPRLLLDMSQVPLLDSAALQLLFDQQLASLERGGVIKLCGVSPLCNDILNVTGLKTRFEMFDNQMMALGSFAA